MAVRDSIAQPDQVSMHQGGCSKATIIRPGLYCMNRLVTSSLGRRALEVRHMFLLGAGGGGVGFSDFNWGFWKGLLSLVPLEPPPAVWGRDRNGFPWERTGAPPDQESEALMGLLIGGGRFSERNIGDWGRGRRNSGSGGTVHHGNGGDKGWLLDLHVGQGLLVVEHVGVEDRGGGSVALLQDRPLW